MIPVYRRVYQAGPRALEATGKATLVYDVPADSSLACWDAVLLSSTVIGYVLATSIESQIR